MWAVHTSGQLSKQLHPFYVSCEMTVQLGGVKITLCVGQQQGQDVRAAEDPQMGGHDALATLACSMLYSS